MVGFRESLKLYGQLPADFQEKASYRRNVGITSNNLAWLLAMSTSKERNIDEAVAFAKQAVELTPTAGSYWNTLGVAQYRAGDWKAAAEAIEKSMALRKGGDGDAFDWFVMAMIQRQRNDKAKAREWFDKAVAWIEKHEPKNEELIRFRAEAEAVLGIKEKGD